MFAGANLKSCSAHAPLSSARSVRVLALLNSTASPCLRLWDVHLWRAKARRRGEAKKKIRDTVDAFRDARSRIPGNQSGSRCLISAQCARARLTFSAREMPLTESGRPCTLVYRKRRAFFREPQIRAPFLVRYRYRRAGEKDLKSRTARTKGARVDSFCVQWSSGPA